jgi:thiamine biosynthesis lipoprotein
MPTATIRRTAMAVAVDDDLARPPRAARAGRWLAEQAVPRGLSRAAQRAPRLGDDTSPVPADRRTEVRHIMGMPIGIDLADADGVDVEPAFEWLRLVDATFSTYRDDSDVSRLARGELTIGECRPEVDEVLTRCLALERETGGFFSARPAGRLDPSGYVKGWAVDGAAARLAAAGATSFCINAGGDVVARGRPAPDRLWRVGVRHPEALDELAAVLAVEDLAVATSGEYERGAHILDPHTGAPPAGLLSVTIVGPDLATADAYATAAFAMGAAGPAWTATLEGFDAMCITSDRRVLTTPGFGRHRV